MCLLDKCSIFQRLMKKYSNYLLIKFTKIGSITNKVCDSVHCQSNGVVCKNYIYTSHFTLMFPFQICPNVKIHRLTFSIVNTCIFFYDLIHKLVVTISVSQKLLLVANTMLFSIDIIKRIRWSYLKKLMSQIYVCLT